VCKQFEGFWAGRWGAFTVQTARSFDEGASWGQAAVAYAPPQGQGWDAGSPQMFGCPFDEVLNTSKVVLVFMTSVPLGGGAPGAPGWPDNAAVAVVSAFLNASHPAAPLQFLSAPTAVPLATPTAYWPSFHYDTLLHVVYQDADDNAQESLGAYCID